MTLPDLGQGQVTSPPTWMLHGLRPLARMVAKRKFGARVHHTERIPASGPVIMAANHVGVMDGPFLAVCGPRPVHVLTKEELFTGIGGRMLAAAGQIKLERFHTDPAAIKTCVRALADDRAVGIFPEGARGAGEFGRFHRGAAYLALVSGAPVVPVIMFGTRDPGAAIGAMPSKAGVDIVYGEPYLIAPQPWPRTQSMVEETSLALREHLIATLKTARDEVGRQLPGPLPPGQYEADPATSLTDDSPTEDH